MSLPGVALGAALAVTMLLLAIAPARAIDPFDLRSTTPIVDSPAPIIDAPASSGPKPNGPRRFDAGKATVHDPAARTDDDAL